MKEKDDIRESLHINANIIAEHLDVINVREYYDAIGPHYYCGCISECNILDDNKATNSKNITKDNNFHTKRDYLFKHQAFDNIEQITVGTKVNFAIDPEFMDDKGDHPILLAYFDFQKGLRILNILDDNEQESSDLYDLRCKIHEEYLTKGVNYFDGSNHFFIYSKTSICRAKRPGIPPQGNELTPIWKICGYNPSAPIVVFSAKQQCGLPSFGSYIMFRDNSVKLEYKLSSELIKNTKQEGLAKTHDGTIYYLVEKYGEYLPFVCTLMEFNTDNFYQEYISGNPSFIRVWEYCKLISQLFNDFSKGTLDHEKAQYKILVLNKKIEDILHCEGRYFTITISSNDVQKKTLSFSLFQIYWDTEWNEFCQSDFEFYDYTLIRYVELTQSQFPLKAKDIAEIIASFNIPFGWRNNYADGYEERFGHLFKEPQKSDVIIKDGLLLSDVTAFREQDVIFYFDPWNREKQNFIQREPIKTVEELVVDYLYELPLFKTT